MILIDNLKSMKEMDFLNHTAKELAIIFNDSKAIKIKITRFNRELLIHAFELQIAKDNYSYIITKDKLTVIYYILMYQRKIKQHEVSNMFWLNPNKRNNYDSKYKF